MNEYVYFNLNINFTIFDQSPCSFANFCLERLLLNKLSVRLYFSVFNYQKRVLYKKKPRLNIYNILRIMALQILVIYYFILHSTELHQAMLAKIVSSNFFYFCNIYRFRSIKQNMKVSENLNYMETSSSLLLTSLKHSSMAFSLGSHFNLLFKASFL